MFNSNNDIFTDEVNLNVRLVFPIVQALSRAIDDIQFLPGEINRIDERLYFINCFGSVKIPSERETSEPQVRELVNLMWFLK
ncbi:hypothetical protein MBANPS3_007677, partial [Mucor bainieri]